MKKSNFLILLFLFIAYQPASALTFTVYNSSLQPVEIEGIWDGGFTQVEEDIPAKSKAVKSFNTKGHKLQMIRWAQNNRCYGVDLRDISSNILLNKSFIILNDGWYTHNIITPAMKLKALPFKLDQIRGQGKNCNDLPDLDEQ